ncbi:MAG: MBL fold metallo-hydrolase [Sphingobacterium sp.]|jgi:glyoxylase-like metal-dependent hydrolase (beta-lactamase superfamily II)|nr:MBL fold metallo-hydrolase [Sphingobacterium sp.]
MNRRELIKKTALAAGLGIFSSDLVFGQKEPHILSGANSMVAEPQRLELGDLEIFILSDGFLRLSNLNAFSSRADIGVMKNILHDNFRSEDFIDTGMNIPLVRTKDRLVLIDSGMGIFSNEMNGKLLDCLSNAGIKPEQITDIFISHAHIDHIGGLVDKNNNLVFQRAKHHIAQIEFEFWMNAGLEDFKNSDLSKNPKNLLFEIDAAKRILSAIKPNLLYFDYQNSLYEHFTFELVGGHTPGMTFINIRSGDKQFTYIADQAHSDVLLFPYPEWGFFADTDIDLAISSRKKMNKQLSKSRVATIGYHLPYPGIGFIKKEYDRYHWNPLVQFTIGSIHL